MKFKKYKNNLNERLYKESKCIVQDLIVNKKKTFFENKLNENIGKPKELWKTLKDLGLKKKAIHPLLCLKIGDTLTFDAKDNAESFKDFYCKLAVNLLEKLPAAPKRYGKEYLTNYYKGSNSEANDFKFSKVSQKDILILLNDIDSTKAAGIDNISGKFIKDGAQALALPITQICNLSIKLSSFPKYCKVAKVIPVFKKGSKTETKTIALYHFYL